MNWGKMQRKYETIANIITMGSIPKKDTTTLLSQCQHIHKSTKMIMGSCHVPWYEDIAKERPAKQRATKMELINRERNLEIGMDSNVTR